MLFKFKFRLPIYDYSIVYVQADSLTPEELKAFRRYYRRHMRRAPPDDLLAEASDSGCLSGWCLHEKEHRVCTIVLINVRRRDELLCYLEHEKRHAEDFMLKHLGLSGMEASATLSGYLGTHLVGPVLAANSAVLQKR